MKLIFIALAMLAFTNPKSCNSNNDTADATQTKEATADAINEAATETAETMSKKANEETRDITKYMIASINGKDVADKELYIVFDGDKASGFGGCNRFSTQCKMEGDAITFTTPAATKKYCGDKSSVEKEFFKTLAQTKLRTVDNESLLLKDENNKVLFKCIKSKE